ncbi:MAG: aminotransferase class V-fold PLP-dependent enzyme [Bryobacterales bacterium]|nr:aminotransferase class V-fold PLP-dependent enzyme [Bryobacterales bacterium]
MQSDRRRFLASAAAIAVPAAARTTLDFAKIRSEFPWADKQLFLNPAGWHPMRVQTAEAMRRYLEFKVNGPNDGRGEWATGHQDRAKVAFAQLINADPDEISFVQSTLMGENIVGLGLGLASNQGNVVTDELHYEGSIYMYRTLEKQGLELRIVKRKDNRIDPNDVDAAVNRKTRLVACSLISYQNGVRADVKALAQIAHANGAYVYADVIQGAGAVPIDVKALDLDFCACSGYKWLMGDRGLGYLYVRRALHGKVLRRTMYGDRQFDKFQYHMFPYDPPGQRPASWTPRTGAGSFYEVGNIANIVAAGHAESIRFILDLGIDRIQAYVKPMVDRLRKEMPRLGYPCLTPEDTPGPTSAFVVEKPEQLKAKLARRNIDAKVEWNQTRVSCSVYHNMGDIDRFLEAVG